MRLKKRKKRKKRKKIEGVGNTRNLACTNV
jgi:hypothetical protein